MARERRTRDLGNVRCMKNEDGKVLVEGVEIRPDQVEGRVGLKVRS